MSQEPSQSGALLNGSPLSRKLTEGLVVLLLSGLAGGSYFVETKDPAVAVLEEKTRRLEVEVKDLQESVRATERQLDLYEMLMGLIPPPRGRGDDG